MNTCTLRVLGALVAIAVALANLSQRQRPDRRYVVTNGGTASGTVYDTKTELTWQQAIPSTTYTWADAKTYCAGVGASLGGTGWRLPTCKELQTIVDDSRTNPAIDPNAFPSTPSAWFWSSSPVAGSSSGAWLVSSFYGFTYGSAFPYPALFVACAEDGHLDVRPFDPFLAIGNVSARLSVSAGASPAHQAVRARSRESPCPRAPARRSSPPSRWSAGRAKRPLGHLGVHEAEADVVTRTRTAARPGPGLRNTPTWRFQSPLARKYTTRRGKYRRTGWSCCSRAAPKKSRPTSVLVVRPEPYEMIVPTSVACAPSGSRSRGCRHSDSRVCSSPCWDCAEVVMGKAMPRNR